MAGAGVARDLALRGASVALFEKGDFASGTSSKSSKLIHGGLRYLELGDFKLVRESLREKKTLERLAPHLVRPLPVPGAGLPRRLARPHQGAPRHVALRPAHPGQEHASATACCGPSGRARDGAERAGGGPARGRLLLRRPAALPGAPLPRERALGGAPRRAGPQLLPGRGVHPGRARPRRRAGARSPLGPGAGGQGAHHRELRGAVGGPGCGRSRAWPSGARGCCAPPRASTACCRA